MRKLLILTLGVLVCGVALADQNSGSGFAAKTRARNVSTDTVAFGGSLSSSDTTVQQALDTLDNNALATTTIDTSAELRGILTDETGASFAVFADSPVFTDDITLGGATGVKLTGATGVLTAASVGNTNNETLTVDLETTANKVILSTSSAADRIVLSGISQRMNDGLSIYMGSSDDAALRWDTTETNDSLKITTAVGASSQSGNILIVEAADVTTNFGVPTVSNPTLRIQSADATSTSEYISAAHNGTNAVIDVGSGDLNLTPNGGEVNVTGGLTATTDITSSDTGDIGWAIVDQSDNQACNTGCTSGCVFGIDNATGSAVTTLVSCAATTADLCLCAGSS